MSEPTHIKHILQVERTFPASCEQVFQAWTDPTRLKRWFGPEGFKTVVAEVDLRVGGKYLLGMQSADGSINYITGLYHEIQPPTKLVFSWQWAKEFDDARDDTMLVKIEFLSRGAETQVVLTHEQIPSETSKAQHEAGWIGCFDGLEKLLREIQP
jgi:uncharacterized protein YndB with AHSA1/START domain